MRRRLTLTIVGLVAGTLLLAGGGALLVTSWSARAHAVTQLLRQGQAFAHATASIRTPAVLRVVGRTLRLDRAAILVIDPSGHVVRTIPRTVAPLDLPRLPTAVEPASGIRHDLAYALVPVELAPPVSGRLPGGQWTAVLLTRRVGALLSGWGFFLAVGAGTVLVAAAVAAALGRRLTRPLAAASEVTGRIAAGELGARVPVAGTPKDELDALARAINAMAASLEDARRRETELLASVSHDLRTPLTSIRGYAEAIADGVVDDPRPAARIITDQAERLERLVGDLLDLAKVRARRVALRPAPVDVAAAAGHVVDAAGPEARRRGVTVRREVVGDPVATADPDRLVQVLTNLVDNAVVHAASTVAVRAGGPGATGMVWIAVEDDGPGIPAAELGRVFDRFYQLDRSRAAGAASSGLGLSIVAELVTAMGGTCRAESPIASDRARPGSRFVVVLPGGAPPRTSGAAPGDEVGVAR